MANKLYVFFISIITGLLIYFSKKDINGIFIAVVAAIVIGSIPFIIDRLKDKATKLSWMAATLGSILALIAFGLIYPFLQNLPDYLNFAIMGFLVSIVSYLFYTYQKVGGLKLNLYNTGASDTAKHELPKGMSGESLKILDTSIVIDGRIIDLATTGFIEGPLVVPNFVLREIQLISDSADPIKRNRGRRGLEMLNTLQKRDDLEVRISYIDYQDTREVDAKLVKLAIEMGGKLITNDFNLNKVAELQNVVVLNINNLANALKPVVLPGEDMEVQVVKEGKDENQGIGYLDDGTMVVIENAGKFLGKKLKVAVTSVIQTNAGKMIFTKVAAKS